MGKTSFEMKRKQLFTAVLLLVAGCTTRLPVTDEPSQKEEEQPAQQIVDAHVYYSVRAFPDGFDWREEETDGVGSLLLLADGETLVEVEDSPWDAHFVVGGSLYAEKSVDGRTLVLKDGEEILSWDGEESIWDLALDGDSIWCLCTDEEGTSLRKDGEQTLYLADSWPLSDFYDDSGQLCFDLTGEQMGVVCDGAAKAWTKDKFNGENRFHPHSAKGEVWFTLVLAYGIYGTMPSGLSGVVLNADELEILFGGQDVFMECQYGDGRYGILDSGSKEVYVSEEAFDRRVSAIDSNDIWALGQKDDGVWAVFHEGRTVSLPDGVTPKSGCSLALRYGRLLFPVILSDGTAGVWDNGNVLSLGINGYVERISIGQGSSSNFSLSR